jgi:hypothetical protein
MEHIQREKAAADEDYRVRQYDAAVSAYSRALDLSEQHQIGDLLHLLYSNRCALLLIKPSSSLLIALNLIIDVCTSIIQEKLAMGCYVDGIVWCTVPLLLDDCRAHQLLLCCAAQVSSQAGSAGLPRSTGRCTGSFSNR